MSIEIFRSESLIALLERIRFSSVHIMKIENYEYGIRVEHIADNME